MEIKARSGTAEEKIYAAKLAPIIERHHLLLVTLMLWNASSMEALPIFLAVLVPEYLAIIISVTLVLFVGEIIPASILTGPRQLQITASLTPLVYLVLVIFFPIAYPISLGLDFVIGHSDMTIYSRTEISTMMRLQREEGVKRQTSRINDRKSNTEVRDTLYEEDEVVIIDGALKYREMAVSEVMTIAENVFMISVTDTLNYKLIYEIFKAGYSRIPVYDRDFHDIVGLILAKDLIFIDPEVRYLLRVLYYNIEYRTNCIYEYYIFGIYYVCMFIVVYNVLLISYLTYHQHLETFVHILDQHITVLI